MFKCKRHESIELLIPGGSTGTKFEYPDLPQIRDDVDQDIIITGLQTFSVETMPVDYNGNAVATTAQLLDSFLVLYVENEESVRMVPFVNLLTTFQALQTGTTFAQQEIFQLDNLKVNWNKSYVQAGVAYGNSTQFAIILNVYYKKLPPGSWSKITKGMIKGM